MLTSNRENESLREEVDKLRTILRQYETNSSPGVQSTSMAPVELTRVRRSPLPPTIPQKRQVPYEGAETPEDTVALERRFKEELNARRAMPPPLVRVVPGQNSINIPPSTPLYKRNSQPNPYTTIQGTIHSGDSHRHNQEGHRLHFSACVSPSNFSRQQDGTRAKAHQVDQAGHTLHTGPVARSFPISPNVEYRPQRLQHMPGTPQVPQTPTRPSFSGNISTPNKYPMLSRSPQHIPPFIDGLISRGSLKLSAADISRGTHQGNHAGSSLERISLPPKPVMRNPPRSSSRQISTAASLSSPFFRTQVSSGGTHSSYTVRGNSQSGKSGLPDTRSIDVTTFGKDSNLSSFENNVNPGFPRISLDPGGLFRRENLSKLDPDLRVCILRLQIRIIDFAADHWLNMPTSSLCKNIRLDNIGDILSGV